MWNYYWGQYLSYWLKDGKYVITFPTPTPNVLNLSQSIQAILSMKSPNIPKTNTYLSKQMHWAMIKNEKSISGAKSV